MKIAIINETAATVTAISECVVEFDKRAGGGASLTDVYNSGFSFLDANREPYDLIFVRAETGTPDGFETAKRIRAYDRLVNIVFISTSADNAIRGYETDAIGYLISPVSSSDVTAMLQKAAFKSEIYERKSIVVKVKSVENKRMYYRIKTSEILYFQKRNNYIVYITKKGEYSERGNLSYALSKLKSVDFIRCNSGCYVNKYAIERFDNNAVVVGSITIPVSRSCKAFFDDVTL